MSGWTQEYSKTYGREYWFNHENGASCWQDPSLMSATGDCKVSIIIPYRDLHAEQHRAKHLERFLSYMVGYMETSLVPFKLFVIEQSNDLRKFNRGKLLNVGFDLALKEGFNVFIFHDVDLLPSIELKSSYANPPSQGPIHIANIFERYNKNPNYFGGIVSFSKDDFQRINGFPNNYWGWGGEDDELVLRVKKCKIKTFRPEQPGGSIEDMEKMSLAEKIAVLKSHNKWKCQKKWELLQEHEATWQRNGLNSLRYQIVQSQTLRRHSHPTLMMECVVAVKVQVDLGLNNEHTDADAGVDFVVPKTAKT